MEKKTNFLLGKNKVLLLIFILAIKGSFLFSQNFVNYNSYYINPYLLNPAECITENTTLQFTHRQQWVGFEGAPKISTFNISTLIDQTRTGLGINATNFSRGLLNTSDVSFTFAHAIPLDPKKTLSFGLSTGISSNNIDLTGVDSNDPVLNSYLSNNIHPAAKFGMKFSSSGGINLGISLPQMFAPYFKTAPAFNYNTFSPFDNIIATAYFRRKVEGRIVTRMKNGVRRRVKVDDSYAPLEFYAVYKYSKNGTNQAEGIVKLNLTDNVWTAAHYRQQAGFAGSVGIKLGRLLFNYAYEPGNQPQESFSSGTHEVNCAIRIGEVKKLKRIAPVLKSTLSASEVDRHYARFQQVDEDEELLNQNENKKFYVVIKSFGDFGSADQFKAKLINDKFNADIVFNEHDRKFHVFVLQSTKAGEAHEEVRNLKLYTKLKTARVLTIIEKKEK